MALEEQARAVADVHEAARLLHAARALEVELQELLVQSIHAAAAQQVPQVVIVEAADVSKGWVSRLLRTPARGVADWRERLALLGTDPRAMLAAAAETFPGVVGVPPFAQRRPSDGIALAPIQSTLARREERDEARVRERLDSGMIPVLSLSNDLAHAVIDGTASEVLVPWETWYRGTIGIHARGRGPGELGRLIGTASAKPAEAHLWTLDNPTRREKPETVRRGAAGFYWGHP